MKKASKWGVALVLASVLALAVAACGGSSTDSATEGSTAASTAGEPVEGTITIWDPPYGLYPGYEKAMKQIDQEFEKANPQAQVKRIAQPEENYYPLVRTTLLSNEPPDALTLIPGNNGILTFSEFLQPLNEYISPELQEVAVGWASSTPGLTEEGTHYGTPASPNGNAFYYNKKLFAKAGLPTEFHPETWTELQEAAEKLKSAGIAPFADGGEGCEIICSWMFGLGLQTELSEKEIGELQTGEMSYTDPQVAKAFQPLINMYNAGLYSKDLFNTSMPEGMSRFENEEAGMVLGLWSVIGSALQFAPKIGEQNLGMFPAPGSFYSSFASQPRAIPANAGNKSGAWALLEFELSKKSQEVLAKNGNLPVRKDVSLPAGTPKQTTEVVEAQANGESPPFPLIVLSTATAEVLDREFAQVLQGRTSVAEAQSAMQEAAEKATH